MTWILFVLVIGEGVADVKTFDNLTEKQCKYMRDNAVKSKTAETVIKCINKKP